MTSQMNDTHRVHVFRGAQWSKDHGHDRAVGGSTTTRPNGRNKPTCPIKEICGTCQYINGNYEQSLSDKHEKGLSLLREAGLLEGTQITKAVASPRLLEYRTHAKLAVRPLPLHRKRGPKANDRFGIGLFEPNTHQIVDLDVCPLHRHTINKLVMDLRKELEKSSLNPYDESKHQGDLRYLSIRASHLTEELMVTFVVTNESKRLELKNMAMRLRQQGHHLSSVYMNLNSDQTNAIFGASSKRILGSDRLRENLCKLSFEIGPSSFFQVNPWQAETIYRRIQQIAGNESGQSIAWDMYCGIGLISMLLTQSGYRTIGIEENPQATRDAQRNVVRNELTSQPSFIAGKVEDLLNELPTWAQDPKLIVVNPSRRGIAEPAREELTRILKEKENTKLLYLSCEVKSLARDLQDLKKSGRKIRQIEAFDMFPFTDKVEWLTTIY